MWQRRLAAVVSRIVRTAARRCHFLIFSKIALQVNKIRSKLFVATCTKRTPARKKSCGRGHAQCRKVDVAKQSRSPGGCCPKPLRLQYLLGRAVQRKAAWSPSRQEREAVPIGTVAKLALPKPCGSPRRFFKPRPGNVFRSKKTCQVQNRSRKDTIQNSICSPKRK